MFKRDALAEQAAKAIKFLPNPEILKSRFRSLEIVLLNRTSHTLEFGNRYYFDSGGFLTAPDDKVKPGSSTVFTCSNAEGSILCGVTGAVQYKILGTKAYLHVGFCNPSAGSYKYFIGTSTGESAQYGYDETVDAAEEDTFERKEYAFKLTAQLHPPVHAQQQILFCFEHDRM